MQKLTLKTFGQAAGVAVITSSEKKALKAIDARRKELSAMMPLLHCEQARIGERALSAKFTAEPTEANLKALLAWPLDTPEFRRRIDGAEAALKLALRHVTDEAKPTLEAIAKRNADAADAHAAKLDQVDAFGSVNASVQALQAFANELRARPYDVDLAALAEL